jgi:uncharacterized membrane protein YdbT with pleckstrin-like domain
LLSLGEGNNMQENKLLENENLVKIFKTQKCIKRQYGYFIAFFSLPILIFLITLFSKHKDMDGTIAFGIICLLLLIPISNSIKRITQETIITNKRIIINSGWMNKITTEIIPEKIESITVEQGLFGKMNGFGNVYIHGLGGTQDPIMYTSEPYELKQIIQNMIQQTKSNNHK